VKQKEKGNSCEEKGKQRSWEATELAKKLWAEKRPTGDQNERSVMVAQGAAGKSIPVLSLR
jgi:hypothetical protein